MLVESHYRSQIPWLFTSQSTGKRQDAAISRRSYFSALDKKNNLLQFKNVLTPERKGYKEILLKLPLQLHLQLYFLQ